MSLSVLFTFVSFKAMYIYIFFAQVYKVLRSKTTEDISNSFFFLSFYLFHMSFWVWHGFQRIYCLLQDLHIERNKMKFFLYLKQVYLVFTSWFFVPIYTWLIHSFYSMVDDLSLFHSFFFSFLLRDISLLKRFLGIFKRVLWFS